MIGTSLSHYRITEKLGQGGMGEVYRAEDTNLSRHVAIKVLPGEFAHDAERLARFEREAKLLASLNHPNIAAIYGLEQADGRPFLVMELVEGQTLAERLKKGRIPLDETLGICRQITEGLEAAHEKGIIHRDLKPANVKLKPEGKVKILDFGLARALAGDSRPPDATHSPTITEAMTRPGVVLGTAAYMAPEQARGKTADKRADIWAFGCVLFECLAAIRAFHGDTITETVAAILKSEPDWTILPAETPQFVRSLLRRCLQKDPALRLHDIADARLEMLEGLSGPAEVVAPAQRFASKRVVSIAAAVLLIGILLGAGVMKYFRPAASVISQPVVRATIKLESGHWLEGWSAPPPYGLSQPTRTAIAISSDGRFIVYGAVKENPGPQDKPHLYLRRTDQSEAKPIVGTEGGSLPFLSPDDRWVGFWTGGPGAGKLMKVPVEGGVPVTLCDIFWPFGASWEYGNSIVFAPGTESGLSKVPADGGKPEILTVPDKTKEEWSHRLPHNLPDGRGVLFTIVRDPIDLQPRVALLDLKTRKWSILLEDAADARYITSGHLIFLRRGTLMAVPFNLDTLEVTGKPVPTVDHVIQTVDPGEWQLGTFAGQFSLSNSGWLVYAQGSLLPDLQNSLVWVDQKGRAEPVGPFKAPFVRARLSPDGQRIAYDTGGTKSRTWIYDMSRGTATPLAGEGTSSPSWSPDGKRVAFTWSKSGQYSLCWQPADGSSALEPLTASHSVKWPGSWSPDGTTLAFVQPDPNGNNGDILLLDLRSRRITPFLNSGDEELYPEFSPDGRWMAYSSNESGRDEVYVRPFPGPGGKWQVSGDGGIDPLWARDGRRLFYRQWPEEQVWVVDVRTDGGFSSSKPRLLFKAPGLGNYGPISSWDISPDGQKFLMVKVEERKPQPVTELILVQNWVEELKRLCPTGRN